MRRPFLCMIGWHRRFRPSGIHAWTCQGCGLTLAGTP